MGSTAMLNKFLAYESERHALESVMRLQAVKRWHMIDTTRQQTLAEHSANVAMLAMLIAKTAPIEWFDTYTHVAGAALVHDLPEAFTGDIPSHTKKYVEGIDELENKLTHVVFKNIDINEHTKLLIKLCDIADGIRFIRLHGVDMTANHAQDGLEEQMDTKFSTAVSALEWPPHLLEHVRSNLVFYAYEAS